VAYLVEAEQGLARAGRAAAVRVALGVDPAAALVPGVGQGQTSLAGSAPTP
jgi:hypothetical protein